MNTRPTPETDKFFATFADGEYAPSHAEYYARLQDLERERDEWKELAAQYKAEHDAAQDELVRLTDTKRPTRETSNRLDLTPSYLTAMSNAPKSLAPCDHDECGLTECRRVGGSDQRLVLLAVAGRMEGSNADFEHRCLVYLAEEQDKLSPDNGLIALLSDGVRLAREYSAAMQSQQNTLTAPIK
jgi:hypothetical protein